MSDIRTIDAYIAEVRAQLAPLSASQRDEVLAELESLLRADAERAGEPAALKAVGDSAAYAAGVLEALHDDADDAEAAGQPTPQGTVLGMPYDFRGMSVDRIGSRVWNPADPRIFMPRMFGLGWTFNLGAIAVKLGLIRPDDVGEDSYERIPPVALAAAVAVPALLAVAAATVLLVAWPMLPAEVPTHWGVSGAPDDWGSRDVVLSILLAFAVVPAALAMEAVLVLGIAVLTVLETVGDASALLDRLLTETWVAEAMMLADGRLSVAVSDVETAQRALPAAISQAGLGLKRFEAGEISLEEVFVDLVGGER